MKFSILALATVAALAGCAGPGVRMEPDLAQINTVERAARLHGYQLVWVNAPMKAVKTTNGT